MKLFARSSSSGRSKGAGRRLLRISWKLALLIVPLAVVFGVVAFYGLWAQTFDMKKVGEMPERNTVLDVDGKIYSRLAGANRLKVSLNEISPYFVDALLAREDTRFFQHGGIDWRGIARAAFRDIVSGSAKEGASSITQQLARNSLPLGGRTISRKFLEAMVALRIEREFTKQQILELYINRIYFGAGCYGVETASLAYFGKDAAKLNLSEAGVLAGLIRSPNRFSPLKNPEGAAQQRNAVVDRMLELKKIDHAQAEQAKSAKINPNPKRLPMIQENYAMDAVQRDLNLLLTPDQIDNGGLYIYTTLDPMVQNAATQALEAQLTKIEHSRITIIPQRPATGRRRRARIRRCRICRVRSSRSIIRAAASARCSGGAITRRVNSTARFHQRTGRSARLSSRSSTRLHFRTVYFPARRSATGPFNRAKLKARETGRRGILTAPTGAFSRFLMALFIRATR